MELDPYKPLVTYDNVAEIGKIRKYAPHAGLVLRPEGAQHRRHGRAVLKFGGGPGRGRGPDRAAHNAGLVVEGLSFHVGSQPPITRTSCRPCNLRPSSSSEARSAASKMNLLDIGGGFPAPYDAATSGRFRRAGPADQRRIRRLFPPEMEILAEPGVSWSPPPPRSSPR